MESNTAAKIAAGEQRCVDCADGKISDGTAACAACSGGTPNANIAKAKCVSATGCKIQNPSNGQCQKCAAGMASADATMDNQACSTTCSGATPVTKRLYIYIRKYLLCGYILGVLTHTTAWDRH